MIANLTRDILEAFLPVGMVDILMPLLGILIVVNVLLGSAVMLTYAERRLVARMQNRIGPNRVGPFGTLQGVADLLKLVIKEDLTPRAADRLVFLIAPILFFAPAIALFAVVPFFDGWAIADLDAGIVYVIAVTSVSSLAAFAAGWASNNKYSLYGAMRGVAQLVSYESASYIGRHVRRTTRRLSQLAGHRGGAWASRSFLYSRSDSSSC